MAIDHVVVGTRITADHQNEMIDQINQNTDDIEYLKTTGGGTPTDPFVDWFEGEGPPPTVIPGAGRGDMYHDKTNNKMYQLQ